MSDQLYKVKVSSSFMRMSTSEFCNAIYETAKLIDSPLTEDERRVARFQIWGEWYCQSGECHVREVRVRLKYEDGDAPKIVPIVHCPCCRSLLKFHGHLREGRTLIPVPGGDKHDSQP